MIALACLVVVAQYAFAGHYEREPILELMRRALERPWNPPNDDFREGILIQDVPFLDERPPPSCCWRVCQHTWNVVKYSNIYDCPRCDTGVTRRHGEGWQPVASPFKNRPKNKGESSRVVSGGSAKSPYEPGGRRFESCRARHVFQGNLAISMTRVSGG